MSVSPEQAALAEALRDPRIGPDRIPVGARVGTPVEEVDLAPFTSGRRIEWAARTLGQGEVLAAFADHCRDELDDVEVVEASPSLLVARWRRETSRLELRAGLLALERLVSEMPTMLLVDLDAVDLDALAERFVAEPALRGSIAICDLARLEKINAVRSSVFVYFEWFLRDAYGVKLLTPAVFTQGLIARGVISLGFG